MKVKVVNKDYAEKNGLSMSFEYPIFSISGFDLNGAKSYRVSDRNGNILVLKAEFCELID